MNRAFENLRRGSECSPDQRLESLADGVHLICFNGRRQVAAIATSRLELGIPAEFAGGEVSLLARRELVQEKCGRRDQIRATLPPGILSKFWESGDSFRGAAIVPQANFDSIICR